MGKHAPASLATLIVVNDPQMGLCAAVIVGLNKDDGTVNAVGWTSMGASRTYTRVRHKEAPARLDEAAWDILTWEWPEGGA